MGRDTGIILYADTKNIKVIDHRVIDLDGENINGELYYLESVSDNYELDKINKFSCVEIAYWRKAHSIGNYIADLLKLDNFNSYYKEVTITDLENISEHITEYFKHPEDFESSIWSFQDYLKVIASSLVNINWLIKYLKSHPNSFAIVYDSF